MSPRPLSVSVVLEASMQHESGLSVLSGGRGRGGGAARRSENAVLDRLYYLVPGAVPDFCPGCGGAVEAHVQPWGPSWQCTQTKCQHHAPSLVSIAHLELLLEASPDWSCRCCAAPLRLGFDLSELLPSCERRTTTDWATLAHQHSSD